MATLSNESLVGCKSSVTTTTTMSSATTTDALSANARKMQEEEVEVRSSGSKCGWVRLCESSRSLLL